MSDVPVPPPSLEFLILSMKMQAEMYLGLLHFGEEKDRPEPNLAVAQHTIDLLGVLEQKTKGNLSLDEERLLQNTVTELRFRYVQVRDEQAKKPEASPTSSE